MMVTGAQGASYAISTFLPTDLKTQPHMASVGTGSYLMVLILGAFFGFASGAYLADAIGRKATFMLSAVGSMVLMLIYLLAPNRFGHCNSRKRAAMAYSFGEQCHLTVVHIGILKGATSMAFASDTRGKLDDAQAQIERLREQVEALMKDRITPAVSDLAGRAETAVHSATGAVRGQAEAVSGRVRQQPLIAILIAAGLGWIIGRVMR